LADDSIAFLVFVGKGFDPSSPFDDGVGGSCFQNGFEYGEGGLCFAVVVVFHDRVLGLESLIFGMAGHGA
jgi:hypothetical protein